MAHAETNEQGIDEVVVKIYRCATVVKGGRRFSFGSLVVAGDRKGQVGVGYGKSKEVPSSVDKGKKIAIQAMVPVKLQGGTIPHRTIGRAGACTVQSRPTKGCSSSTATLLAAIVLAFRNHLFCILSDH